MAGALFFVTCSILEPLEARICLKIGSQCLSKGGVFAPIKGLCSDVSEPILVGMLLQLLFLLHERAVPGPQLATLTRRSRSRAASSPPHSYELSCHNTHVRPSTAATVRLAAWAHIVIGSEYETPHVPTCTP